MSNMLGDKLREMLEEYRLAPAEGTQEELQSIYPNITLEDAQRVKDGLTALLDARTTEDHKKQEKQYKALHTELGKKYKKKSGSK